MGWYYVITEEMRALELKGNELIVFAIINGYSQNGEGCYFGSLSHLCEVAGISKPTAIDILKKLVGRDLIVKDDAYTNNVKYCSFRVVKKLNPQLRNFTEGGKETLPRGGKETLPNNKYVDNKELINKDIKKKEKLYKKKYGETVSLTDEEHAKLTASLGEEMTAACIQKLDLYKQANGKTYKSDYAAILNWVVTRVAEERQKAAPSGKMGFLEHNHQLCEQAKTFFAATKPEAPTEVRKNITGNPYEAMLRKNGYYDQHPELDPERHPELYIRK